MKLSGSLFVAGMSVLSLSLWAVGCGGSGGTSGSGGTHGTGGSSSTGGASSSGGSPGTGGSSSGGRTGSGGTTSGSGGTAASGGAVGTGGAAQSGGATGSGGAPASGGTSSGGNGTTGSGGAAGGSTGSGGATSSGGAAGGATGSGGGTAAWACPAASTFTGSPLPSATVAATRIMGAPPADTFNNTGNNFTNVEGPVWIGDSLYFSEMTNATNIPPSRVLKITGSDVVSEFITNSGTNGMAVDAAGNLVTANHGAQGIVRFDLATKTPTTLVSMFNGKKFNCPNDLTIAKDGTIYFSDPDYQDNAKPQGTTSVYQLAPGASTATLITDYTNEPNGVTLSLDEQTLFVDGGSGVKKYAITGGTVAMTGTAFGPSDVVGKATDGMALDCAGNLYVAVSNSTNVVVVKPDGTKLGTVTISGAMAVTNVAFGGDDHQTLYLTGQGSGKGQGVFKTHLNIPGKPY